MDYQTLTKLAGYNNDGYCSITRLMQYSKKPSCNHEILMRMLSLIMIALMLDEDNKIIKKTLDNLISIVQNGKIFMGEDQNKYQMLFRNVRSFITNNQSLLNINAKYVFNMYKKYLDYYDDLNLRNGDNEPSKLIG